MQENIKYAMIWRECKIRKTNQKKVKIQMRKKQWKILCGTVLLFFTFSSFAYPAEAEIPSDSGGTVSETEIWEATPEPPEPSGSQEPENVPSEEAPPEQDNDDDDDDVEDDFPEQTGEGEVAEETIIPTPTPEPLRTPRPKEERESYGPDEFTSDNWRLILVNKQNSIPEGYTFQTDKIQGRMQCDERILDDLLDMLYAAEEDGVNLVICSSYRDMEYQKMLFDRKIRRYMNRGMSYLEAYQLSSRAVTVPGTSEHELGLALDIICNSYTSLDEGFGDTKAGKWLAANSCRFGFILRYPEGRENITGIEYEPWHFRYVGKAAATVIMEQGISLEEFWEEYVEDVSID